MVGQNRCQGDRGRMCADFAIHDKNDGNPHAHIMLTLRSLELDGTWGAKCRKEYLLDEKGHRISDNKGGWKSCRVNTTDWNDNGKAEQWRSTWAEYANRALEHKGTQERVDHRSYARQRIEKIPTVHIWVWPLHRWNGAISRLIKVM